MLGKRATECAGNQIRLQMRLSVAEAAGIAPGENWHVFLELILPRHAPPLALLVCLPGGGMNRRYFDLATPEGEEEGSFANAMVARGFAVALIDPLGVGESSLPSDPYQVTPDVCAAAHSVVTRRVLEGLREGSIEGAPACPGLKSIGIGHSFGAALTIVQQAVDPVHAGIALLGFGLGGLPQYLPPEVAALPPADARMRLIQLAQLRFPEPLVALSPSRGPRTAMLAAASDRLLATTSITAMLPDVLAPDAAAITAPVLLVFGELDVAHGAPHEAPAAYTGSFDVTLLVLAGTRHNHFVYPTRTILFDRLASWAGTL